MDRYYLQQAIETFLDEDIGVGDLTSEAIFPPDQMGAAEFVAKDSFLAAGMEKVAGAVFRAVNPEITVVDAVADGAPVVAGDRVLRLRGPVLDLLKGERVALNLVQRLCGVATLTGRYVEAVKPLPVRIVDTRKTTPGLRVMEKYAVRVGGGLNHRFGLASGILIKDNHIAACGSITTAVERVRRLAPLSLKVEVETEDLGQVEECLTCGVDIIMLDNMDVATMRRAVALVAGRAEVEASGGVSLENVRSVAETGVDIISIGGLTHSVSACDISMRCLDQG